MELMVRCWVPDEPGRLARLAGAIGEVGGDIQAVDVLDREDGRVLDDIVIVVDDEGAVHHLLTTLDAVAGIDVVHAGPSRGDPGEGVLSLAIAFQALLDGSMEPDRAVATLLGGVLRATSCEIVTQAQAPRDGRVLVVALDDERHARLQRDHRFTPAEHRRAQAIAGACAAALRVLGSRAG